MALHRSTASMIAVILALACRSLALPLIVANMSVCKNLALRWTVSLYIIASCFVVKCGILQTGAAT